MRKIYLLFLLQFYLLIQVFPQQNLDISFEDDEAQFVVISSDPDQPSYELEVADGILNIVGKKRAQDWSFLGLFGVGLDLSLQQTLQFSVRSDEKVDFIVRLKSPKISNPEEQEEIKVTTKLEPSENFIYYFVDLSKRIQAKTDFDPSNISEIHIDATTGFMTEFTGLVELDFIKFGFSELLPLGGTGFSETFDDDQLPNGIATNSKYNISLLDGSLNVSTDRAGRWPYFDVQLGARYDISENPIVNLKCKTNKSMVLQLFLMDGNGNGYKTEITGGQYKYVELIENSYEYRQARVYEGETFIELFFDFSDVAANIVDLSNITALRFVINGTQQGFKADFQIDDIKIGDHSQKIAYIGQLPDLTYMENAQGTKNIIIPEIHNTDLIEMVGTSSLLSNITISPVDYFTADEFNNTITYGNATLSFDIKQDVSGSETITLKALGKEGFVDNEVSFDVNITGNNPPEVDDISDMIVIVGKEYVVDLSGIDDGNPEAFQNINVEAKSENASVVAGPVVDYQQGFMKGKLTFTPSSPGEAEIAVKITDEPGLMIEKSFVIMAYEELNAPPTIDQVAKVDMYITSEGEKILLTGIDDGDGSDQNLTITATSSNTEVVELPEIYYQNGESTADLTIKAVGEKVGVSEITIEITDDGGNDKNNGDQTTIITFDVEVTYEPVSGYELDFSDEGILNIFQPEGRNVIFFLDIVDTLGSEVLRVEMKDKWTYGGIWVNLPEELNLKDNPVVSYDVFSLNKSSWHWNYLYEAHEVVDHSVNRNIQNSEQHQLEAPANQWTTLSFDYRQPGDLNNNNGEPIDASRIVGMLLNMHDVKANYPFTDASGVLYIKNIRIGSQAVFEPLTATCTINNIPDQAVFSNSGQNTLLLKGISNGNGSVSGIKLSADITDADIVNNIIIGEINSNGECLITYSVVSAGATNIKISVEAEGSESISQTFKISSIGNNPESYATITYDLEDKHQEIRGLGTFHSDTRFTELYTEDLGASAIRIGVIRNQWEPVNDNSDPDVINMKGFNYDAFDWEYFRKLKENGVEQFILTSWSPPAWMKRCLGLDHREQALAWENTDNILEPYYYEEFAESMAALVKAFKDKSGIDISAVGLQNEPFFNEPYPSAILSGEQFAKLIKITGDRFKKEGLGQVGFFMPEQVFGLGWGGYSNEGYLKAVTDNPEADAYCDFFAVHGYDGTGITAGFPDYSNWKSLFELAQSGDNPKEMWMTETHIGYEGWNSALKTAGAIHGSLWAGNITLWTNWSFTTMQLTKNIPNSTFYTSKNYFKYIRPGAVRIHAESDYQEFLLTSFLNSDGKLVFVIINKGNDPKPVNISGKNLPGVFSVYRTSQYEDFIRTDDYKTLEEALIIPASSVVTLVADELGSLEMDRITDIVIPENAPQQEVLISGISNENGGIELLNIKAENSNNELFSAFEISEISSSAESILIFEPAENVTGQATVKITLSDDKGNELSQSFIIFVEKDSTSGMKNIEKQFKYYPVPVKDKLFIEIPKMMYSSYQIIDITGKILFADKVYANSAFEIDMSNYLEGLYLIKLNGYGKSETFRIIKQ